MNIVVATANKHHQRLVRRAANKAGFDVTQATDKYIILGQWPYVQLRLDVKEMYLCAKRVETFDDTVGLSTEQVLEALT